MVPEGVLPASDVVLKMIRCSCGKEKTCSQANLSCSLFCNWYGKKCFNVWTVTEDDDADEGSDDDQEDDGDNGEMIRWWRQLNRARLFEVFSGIFLFRS